MKDSKLSPVSPEEIPFKLITENQVSEFTKIPVQSLRNMRCVGEGIPYHKIGRRVRYSIEDVLDYLENCRIVPRNKGGK